MSYPNTPISPRELAMRAVQDAFQAEVGNLYCTMVIDLTEGYSVGGAEAKMSVGLGLAAQTMLSGIRMALELPDA